jgi:antitoxin component YwqK of YwqJK toxin-antitoxin module
MLKEIKNKHQHYFKDKQGRRQGEFKWWWTSGQILQHCFYVNDSLHGECKTWHEIGNLGTHYFFLNNNFHGEYKMWYDNGQLEIHCYIVKGTYHGEYKHWWHDGTLIDHFFYVDDKKVSFDEIPYPVTPEDYVYFVLKYNMQLLPVETKC